MNYTVRRVYSVNTTAYYKAQSKPSARLFLLSSELGPPTPSSVGECVLPFGLGGHTRLREGGVGSQLRRGADIVVFYVYLYFVEQSKDCRVFAVVNDPPPQANIQAKPLPGTQRDEKGGTT
jgi:hypothetical protein